jgi:choline dehydrogenase-like flavoprotein
MANLNLKAAPKNTFDAIVIGSGMAGGWAAKELCEKGLKTLVLERGKEVKHITDYPTAIKDPWDFEHHGKIPYALEKENPVLSRCYAWNEGTDHFLVKDKEHPYIQDKPFDWIRGYQTGGKSLLWARQVQRWSDFDFEGPARDGFAVDWPIRYKDLSTWYDYVERFAGVSGNRDGIPQLPDGIFQPAMNLNIVEQEWQKSIATHYTDRQMIVGRVAHITAPTAEQTKLGRVKCQHRDLCYRGCPFGGYFSSNSSTIPAAQRTKKMTMRSNAIVESILFDEKKQRAKGVRVIDAVTKQTTEYYAKVIFVTAACLNTNLILLNSKSTRFPNGFGNDNGLLGRYVAFHNYRGRAWAEYDGHFDKYVVGKRPTGAYIPRFRNVQKQEMDFLRGYAIFASAGRAGWQRGGDGFGAEFKENLTEPGPWGMYVQHMGETIPKEKNHVHLDPSVKDVWGMPVLRLDIDYDENDEKMLKDFAVEIPQMLEKAGFKNISVRDSKQAPGLDIHEMGGVRMGRDPKTSLLNEWNQMHACKNVFVTDGASMTSVATQNPSLTFMALTARAANYAVTALKKRNL